MQHFLLVYAVCQSTHLRVAGLQMVNVQLVFAIVHRRFRDGRIFEHFSKHQALFRSYMDLSCCFILYTCTIYALFYYSRMSLVLWVLIMVLNNSIDV